MKDRFFISAILMGIIAHIHLGFGIFFLSDSLAGSALISVSVAFFHFGLLRFLEYLKMGGADE